MRLSSRQTSPIRKHYVDERVLSTPAALRNGNFNIQNSISMVCIRESVKMNQAFSTLLILSRSILISTRCPLLFATAAIQTSNQVLIKFVPGAEEWYCHLPLTDTQPDLLSLGFSIQPLGTHSNQRTPSLKPLNPQQRPAKNSKTSSHSYSTTHQLKETKPKTKMQNEMQLP